MNLEFFVNGDGQPWHSYKREGKVNYVVVRNVEHDHGGFLHGDNTFDALPHGASFLRMYPHYRSWQQISEARAYELLGLKAPEQERRYYIFAKGELFQSVGGSGPYGVFYQGTNCFSIRPNGEVKAIASYNGDEANAAKFWVRVSKEKLMSMLGHKPNFDASALVAAIGPRTPLPDPHGDLASAITKTARELIAKAEAKGIVKADADEKSPLLFRHLRYHDDFNEVQGNGGLTFGFVINHTKEVLEVYPAVCSLNDTFAKDIGRHQAAFRHRAKQGFVIPYTEGLPIADNLFYFAWDLLDGTLSMEDIKYVDGREVLATSKGDNFEQVVETFLRVAGSTDVC